MSRACPPAPPVEVQVIGRARVADLVIIGSHCLGLDVLIGRLQSEGISVKALNVGSTGGLGARSAGVRYRRDPLRQRPNDEPVTALTLSR